MLWGFSGPVVAGLLYVLTHREPKPPKPVAPVVAFTPVRNCWWHQYDGERRQFEVCDDHRTGRTRKAPAPSAATKER